MAGEIEKMGNGQVASILASGGYILAVTMVDKDGAPVVIGGGESGGSTQLKQGESDVSSTNPLPIGLLIKNQMGNWVTVSPFNPVTVRDLAVAGALVNNGSDPNSGQMMLIAGAGAGGTRAIPVSLSGQDDAMTLVPVGGVDQDGKQKTFNFNGDRAKVELQNANGAFSEANPLDTQNATLGKKDDAVATSDTATSSLISLFKRLLGKFASLGQKTKSGSMPVVIASDQDALSVVRKEAFNDNGAFQAFSQNTNLLTGANTWFDASGYNAVSFNILGDSSANYQLRVLMTNNPSASDLQGVYPYVSDLTDASAIPNQNDIYVYSNNNKNFEIALPMRYLRVYVVNVPSGNLRVASRMLPNGYSSMKSFIPKGVKVSETVVSSTDSYVRGFYALLLEGLNDTVVTAGGTRLLDVVVSNSSTTDYWVKLYSKNTTSGLSATTPDFAFLCKAGTTTPINLGAGRWFSFGIVFRVSKTASNSDTNGIEVGSAGLVTINISRSL
ncbi:hypothetical protein QM480_06435 [Flectobacillus sp. DC10W]|uniref:Tail fiber protein n=1 Tax=Flectobacillus longus TaxID=2984207 RepID=A0ABT6YKG8_9BACT|nr:hypothetical protein [Flectobacillus longus]MDI9863952.1 hypothetical protein [Flectobacillus longus]